MSDRITIPSSESGPEDRPDERIRPGSLNVRLVTVLVLVVGSVALAAWVSSRGPAGAEGDSDEAALPAAPEEVAPAPEPARRGSTTPISGVEIPGIGAVVAGFDHQGFDHVVVSDEWYAGSRSTVWRREARAWTVAGALDGPVTHAANWNGQIVAVGIDWSDLGPIVHIGVPGDMDHVELDGSSEYAFRVEALGEQVAVYSQSFDETSELTSTVDLRASTAFAARVSSDGRNWTKLQEPVFDLAETSRGLLAVGETGSVPRIWRVAEGGALVDTDLVPPSDYRPVSILESDDELLVLAISRGLGRDAEIWKTVGGQPAVVATLDTSVWNRLERRGDEYVVFGDAAYYATSRDGRGWSIVALRHDVPGAWEPRSARVAERGLEFYGSRVDRFGEPVMLTTSPEAPFNLPEPEWQLEERLPEEFVAFTPGVAGDLAVTAPGSLLFRAAGSTDWQETDARQIAEWHQVMETNWGWVLQTDGATLRSTDGSTWEEVARTPSGASLSPFDGDVLSASWSGGEVAVVGEQAVTPLPPVGVDSTVGYVEGVGVVAVGFSGPEPVLRVLVDGEWQPLLFDSLPGWPSFGFDRLFVNSNDAREVVVLDPSSGEFLPVDGPVDRGQIFAPDMRSVVWAAPVGGMFVADESLRWHRVTFDPAAGMVERVASVTLIDGTVIVTARDVPERFSSGTISVYSRPLGDMP